MKKTRLLPVKWSRTFLVASCGLLWSIPAHGIPLPAASALPAGSSTTPGFAVRVAQAPEAEPVADNSTRAAQQINGTLLDSLGAPVPDESVPGPQPDESYIQATINFEKDAAPFDLLNYSNENALLASFVPELFPGIPGSGGHTSNFAVEAVGFLELPVGTHTFGISVGTDRTDVNDDDSYAVFVSRNPRDFFGLKVAEFSRNGVPAFGGNTKNENLWTVEVTTAGLYPFRVLFWQGSRGSNLQFYSVKNEERILVNDLTNPAAIKSFAKTTVADAKGPYVAEARPVAGSAGNSAAARIEAVIVDGTPATVPAAGVQMRLNGTLVTPVVTRTAPLVKIAFSPNPNRTNPQSDVRLNYTDSAGVAWQKEWSYGINVSGGSGTTVTGQWDFNSGNLTASVGQALQYFDGPTGLTQRGTKFGTTASLGVSPIAGREAGIMEIPGDLKREIGYIMTHGISPNGGGTRVNQYTLIMDVFVNTAGPGAASLLQTSSANNTDDGDLFWQGNNFGQGGGGYNGTGQFTAGSWHRVVAAYDMAATPPVVTKYVDCIKQDDWTANQGLDNTRRSMAAAAILFGDGDQDERRKMWVNSIQVRSGKMTDAEIVALGGPSADGIPIIVPPTKVTGQWDFERGNLAATAGKALTFLDGVGGLTEAGTQFGLCSELGVPLIEGQNAKIMKVPGDLKREIGYVMDHGIKPNGGGTRVNQYTLAMDVFVATTGPGAASLLQLSSLTNSDDGDLFWQGNNFGQGAGGYNGTGQFTGGAWHRVVAAYDEAATPPVVTKYVDGIKQDDWTANQGLDNVRRAMQPTAILFGDGDQDERREMFVNSIQIREGKLTDAEIYLLGKPQASGLPVSVPASAVTGQWDFERGNLASSIGKPLTFFDGPEGLTKTGTLFGTCTELGVEVINGRDARIMRIPGELVREIGYVMDHGIKPNGGGTKVNQYTLAMDIYVAASGPGAASLLQLSSLTNTDDGDLFWQGNNFGQGSNGYIGTGQWTAGSWHRVVAAYDEAATPPVVTKFVDGIKQDDWTANQGLDNVRRAMQPTAILFGDGDRDERREMFVDSIQIRAGKLSDDEMIAMGAPNGIALPVGPLATSSSPVAAESTELSIALVQGAEPSIVLSWPALSRHGTIYSLESSDTMSPNSWTPVPTTGTSVTIPVGPGKKFFRLRY